MARLTFEKFLEIRNIEATAGYKKGYFGKFSNFSQFLPDAHKTAQGNMEVRS